MLWLIIVNLSSCVRKSYESPIGTRSYKWQFKVTLDFPVISVISCDTFPTFNQSCFFYMYTGTNSPIRGDNCENKSSCVLYNYTIPSDNS